jgi:hypothetical protein
MSVFPFESLIMAIVSQAQQKKKKIAIKNWIEKKESCCQKWKQRIKTHSTTCLGVWCVAVVLFWFDW